MRRRVVAGLVAVLVTVGLAGCGDGGDGAPQDAGGRPLLPSSSGGGGGASQARVKVAAPAAADAAGGTAEAMLAPVRPVEYRLADDAKAPATSAPAYKVVKQGDLAVADVLQALGLGREEAENVEIEPGLGWFYASVPDEPVASSVPAGEGCGVADVTASDVPMPEEAGAACAPAPEPAPPAGVPTAAEVEARLRKALDRLGVDVGEGRFEGDDGTDVYARTVTFTPSVGGVPADGLQSALAIGGEGRIEYASGFTGRLEKLGDYPLVGVDEAFERFQDGGGGVRTMAEPAVDPAATDDSGAADSSGAADDLGAAADSDAAGGANASADDGGPVMTIEPQPAPAPVPLEPQIIELHGPKIVLEVVYPFCEDGDYFLVPTYAFDAADGPEGGFRVPAVDDASLQSTGGAADDDATTVTCTGDEDDPATDEPMTVAPDEGVTPPAGDGTSGSSGSSGGGVSSGDGSSGSGSDGSSGTCGSGGTDAGSTPPAPPVAPAKP